MMAYKLAVLEILY